MLDEQPPAFRVSWIKWDSAFRSAGLRVGDHIVAVNGKPVAKPANPDDVSKMLPSSIGQYDESRMWAAAGAHAGDALKLTVRRRNVPGIGWTTLDINGRLMATQNYSTEDGRPALAPGGPESMASDDFDGSWSSWYDDKLVPQFSALLDGAWQRASFVSQFELTQHQALKPRVDYLNQHYPGTFAHSVKDDWQTVADSLAGAKVNLTGEDLRWRRAEDERVQHVKDASASAFAAFQASVAGQTIPAFPALDPTQTDSKTVAGKYVVLPQIRSSDWLDNGGRTFFAFSNQGNPADGYWFAEEERDDAQAMLLAAERYRRLVTTSLEETYTIVGRVTAEPALKVVNGRGFYGMVVEIAAAMLGDAVFVDLTKRNGTSARFTCEDEVDQPMHALPPEDAPPSQILETLFGALKLGDAKLWKALYAGWRVATLDNGQPLLYLHEDGVPDQYWEYSRESMHSRVYGLRVCWIGEPRALMTGKEFEGAPRIDEVDAEIDHIGLFNGEYRVFKDVTVNRVWKLQRMNGSGWRIATLQQI